MIDFVEVHRAWWVIFYVTGLICWRPLQHGVMARVIDPANTIHSTNVGSMLVQRRRRWANIEPTLVERLVFSTDEPSPACVDQRRVCGSEATLYIVVSLISGQCPVHTDQRHMIDLMLLKTNQVTRQTLLRIGVKLVPRVMLAAWGHGIAA